MKVLEVRPFIFSGWKANRGKTTPTGGRIIGESKVEVRQFFQG